jgi:two-component system cell cycle sensor histidine kinase/response regulator CckA
VHVSEDAREVTVESRWVVYHDDVGGVAGILAVDRDVTDRLKLAAERADDRLGDAQLQVQIDRSYRLESVDMIASGIAHHFNNILGAIINYAAFLGSELRATRGAPGESRSVSVFEAVTEIEIAARRAALLSRQLLAFSRPELARPVALDLNDTIRGVETLLRHTAGENVEFAVVLDERLHAIHADPAQLARVLLNVAANSFDAMTTGGRLTIDTANIDIDTADADIDAPFAAARRELAPGAYVRLRVSDTGVGMIPTVRARAFDPLFTTKAIGQGTGLGLATVNGIVARLGGRAWLDSQPGVGTTFAALIPASDVRLHTARAATGLDGAEASYS